MKKLISIFLFLISIFGYSQTIFVPFKVGNLFGISDEKGNLKITPTFDYINISSDQNNYFLAYKCCRLPIFSTVLNYNIYST